MYLKLKGADDNNWKLSRSWKFVVNTREREIDFDLFSSAHNNSWPWPRCWAWCTCTCSDQSPASWSQSPAPWSSPPAPVACPDYAPDSPNTMIIIIILIIITIIISDLLHIRAERQPGAEDGAQQAACNRLYSWLRDKTSSDLHKSSDEGKEMIRSCCCC